MTIKQQIIDDLTAARALITPYEQWTRDVYARNHRKEETDPCDPEATCWCAYGALHKVTGASEANETVDDPRYQAAVIYLVHAAAEEFHMAPEQLNDHGEHGHDDVLFVYDRAIERAKAGG